MNDLQQVRCVQIGQEGDELHDKKVEVSGVLLVGELLVVN